MIRIKAGTDPQALPNGSLMRLEGVPMYVAADPRRAIDAAAGSSRSTHAAPIAVDACRSYAALLTDALEAALEAFAHSTTFADGCLLAVNLGDDGGTTGAIYGQLAGAFYGESRIPAAWRAGMCWIG